MARVSPRRIPRPGRRWFIAALALGVGSIGIGFWASARSPDGNDPSELQRHLAYLNRVQAWGVALSSASYLCFGIAALRSYGHKHRLSAWTCSFCGNRLPSDADHCPLCRTACERPSLRGTGRRWSVRLRDPNRRWFALGTAILVLAYVLNALNGELLRRETVPGRPFDPARFHQTQRVFYGLLACAGAAFAAGAMRASRRKRWTKAGMCIECGYDLRASPERCPECGAQPASHDASTRAAPADS